ncbi:rCG51854 [Rattus norvegicus]|uniref:RCG51854 n=1 Tax=Rattus norvegicus TaxID=10116 RepID=A6K3R5_RAT|nr:rCG51854 [Rattus norvegicus]
MTSKENIGMSGYQKYTIPPTSLVCKIVHWSKESPRTWVCALHWLMCYQPAQFKNLLR